MNFKLSVASRILVAFASGALIAVYFLPAWRIDLFAPQYPEGLSMYIWINKLSGDVDIINGLNHYIGMKHISAEMFPEFRFMPLVVGFFMLLGMIAAISGKGKALFTYVILSIIGAAFVPYDLYRWGYKYGHDLDPHAAIQVPGLSYQPPVFGHKRLLNFDAYSFPDIAGWIVFGAGLLVTCVWLWEWWMNKKSKKRISPAVVTIVSAFLLISISSCKAQPQPFTVGKDDCHVCKMGIADLKFGGEILTKKGKVYKFDDVGCMMNFLNSGTLDDKEISQKLIIDYNKPNTFLSAEKTYFLASENLKSPMRSNIAGFVSKDEAQKAQSEKKGEIVTWNELLVKTKD